MKTQIVYILTSSYNDTFLESALISLFSLREIMPEVHVILLVDDKTNETFTAKRREILDFISEKKVITFEKSTGQKERSRILKTLMRKHIEGDFLYIDSDTLITKPLYEIDSCQYSIAAVLDGHIGLKKHPCKDIFTDQSYYLNFQIEKIDNYYAGGVLYVKDDYKSHAFFDLWHRNYLYGMNKGITQDEPSLNKTNYESGNMIGELHGDWNCQYRLGGLFLKTAKIIHFLSKKDMPLSLFATQTFLDKIKVEGINAAKPLITNYWDSFYSPMGLIANDDLFYTFTSEYNTLKKIYFQHKKSPFSLWIKTILFWDKEKQKSLLIKFFIHINNLILKLELLIAKICYNKYCKDEKNKQQNY